MTIYRINNKEMVEIQEDLFLKEKDIQSLIEANLEILFSLNLLQQNFQ